MKIFNYSFTVLFILILFLGCSVDSGSSSGDDDPAEKVYEIGDSGPAGGKIFYIDADDNFDWTYLEAAPPGWDTEDSDENSETTVDPRFLWGGYGTLCSSLTIPAVTSLDLGTGEVNTTNLLAPGHATYHTAPDHAARILL